MMQHKPEQKQDWMHQLSMVQQVLPVSVRQQALMNLPFCPLEVRVVCDAGPG